jgi:hypothetical protein
VAGAQPFFMPSSIAPNFSEIDMRTSLSCLFGAVSVIAVAYMSASADNLKSVVRTLNAIVNPEDAWRLEDQAHRFHRPDEEHYWHNYGAGLEQQRRERGEGGPQYSAPGRYMTPIDPDEARRLQDQARRYGQPSTERYWGQYREGLEGPAGPR